VTRKTQKYGEQTPLLIFVPHSSQQHTPQGARTAIRQLRTASKMADFESQKRLLSPLLTRAEEIEKHQPKIAYYMRLHAADQARTITPVLTALTQ
jgi:hypothetical protein